jgi:hypothetical protein
VQGRFIGDSINRRKQYAAAHRDALPRVHDLRLMADYDDEPVTQTQAMRVAAVSWSERWSEEVMHHEA